MSRCSCGTIDKSIGPARDSPAAKAALPREGAGEPAKRRCRDAAPIALSRRSLSPAVAELNKRILSCSWSPGRFSAASCRHRRSPQLRRDRPAVSE